MKGMLLMFAGLCLMGQVAAANLHAGALSEYLPADNDVAGLKLAEPPDTFSGKDLFQMINGGAAIYHEYGFRQVLEAAYTDGSRHTVRLEIYKMASPASAYGMFTFKTGGKGQALSIGQDALLRDYYLNFWKGDMLVTVIGMDSKEETVKGVIALAQAVDKRIAHTGERPELADLLLSAPLEFSQPTYIRGSLGLMGRTLFDREKFFHVREGVIGTVGACQTIVFRYQDEDESAETFEAAAERLAASERFRDGVRKANHYSMVSRNQDFVLINLAGAYIAIVIGQNQDQVTSTAKQLVEKLTN